MAEINFPEPPVQVTLPKPPPKVRRWLGILAHVATFVAGAASGSTIGQIAEKVGQVIGLVN